MGKKDSEMAMLSNIHWLNGRWGEVKGKGSKSDGHEYAGLCEL